MRIKRYVARDMREALGLVKKDLGPEALILESRRVRQKGLMGFFRPLHIEVTAAVDKRTSQGVIPRELDTLQTKTIQSEIDELKSLVKQVMIQQNGLLSRESKEKSPLDYLYRQLVDSEVEKSVARDLLKEVGRDCPEEKLTQAQAHRQLRDKIGKRLKPVDFNGQKYIFCFVGATGVGKTTTLAKLAAHYAILKGKKVGLITLDTYRIGAVEQLRSYARLMDLPLEVVMSPRELEEALMKMNDMDYIMVDTAGRNSKNFIHIQELQSFSKVLPEPITFLCLSATTRWQDMALITNNFKPLNYNALIFTKLDETSSFGTILNAACHTTLPVAFLTNGQKVPEDLEIPSVERLTDLILGGKGL